MMTMMTMKNHPTKSAAALAALLLGMTMLGCGTSSGKETEQIGLGADVALPLRQNTVLIDGCVIDAWQRATLATPAAKRVLQEVILLCLVPRADGTVGPRDPSALANLTSITNDLKKDGYRVKFAIAFTDESGQRVDGAQTRTFLSDPAWRARVVDSTQLIIASADGVEVDLQQLPNDAQPFVTAFIAELSQKSKPKTVGVFVPPSVTIPSDLPGGDAFSRRDLAPYVDRMRIMTLDYSDQGPGPTIDPGWAVDAVRLAHNDFPKVDISYPLYGTDFGPGEWRSISYLEARAISLLGNAPIERGPTGAPFVRYIAFGNQQHELWYDDAESTARALGAWTYDVLPSEVGVLFYGLGAEDPTLFNRLSEKTPSP